MTLEGPLCTYCRVCTNSKTIRNFQRAVWYLCMSMLQDKARNHHLGLVGVLSCFHLDSFSILQMWNMRRIRMALPLHLVGAHICYDGNEMHRLSIAGIRLFQHCNPKRCILRVHEGEPFQAFANLRAFGIPVDDDTSPLSQAGEQPWSTEWHLQWLQNLRNNEERNQIDPSTDDYRPRRFDVLFGKDKEALKHPGTLRCNYLVEILEKKYEMAHRRAKTQIADEVLAIMQASHGRFLKRDNKGKGWKEVDKATAREKISHLFRQKRSKVVSRNEGPSAESVHTTKTQLFEYRFF